MRGRVGRQDDVRHPVPDGAARLAAGGVRGRRRADRHPHRRPAHDPHGPGRRRTTSTTWPTRTASSAPCTSPATSRTWARAPRTTSATSSPSPTSAPSCTSARPTAATRCSARSPTACARRRTTAGRPASSWPSSSCCSASSDKQTGRTYHVCGGFPSASGKTNLAMMLAAGRPGRPLPRRVLRRRHRLAPGRPRGRQDLRDQPRVRRVRRRQGHQRGDQPDRASTRSRRAPARCSPTSPTTRDTQEVWWEGKTPEPPADVTGWRDWTGELDQPSGRTADADEPWAHPNSRFTTTLANVPEHRRRTSRTPRACRSTRSSSAAAPATASRWSARSPTSPRASTTA